MGRAVRALGALVVATATLTGAACAGPNPPEPVETPWPGGAGAPEEAIQEYFRGVSSPDQRLVRAIVPPHANDPSRWATTRTAPVRVQTIGWEPSMHNTTTCVVSGTERTGQFRTGLTLIQNAGRWYVMHEWNPRRTVPSPTSWSTYSPAG